jgi:hypothetical protein
MILTAEATPGGTASATPNADFLLTNAPGRVNVSKSTLCV